MATRAGHFDPGAQGFTPEREVLFALDPQGTVTFIDEGIADLTGRAAGQSLGRTLESLVYEEDRPRGRDLVAWSRTGRRPDPIELRLSSTSAEPPVVQIALVPHCRDGRVVRILGVARDLTQRSRVDRQLAAVQDLARVGVWEWDRGADQVTWSDELYRIYGVPVGEPITFASLLARVIPEDRDVVQAGVTRALAGGGTFHYGERIVRGDGAVRHLSTLGEAVCDASGQVIRLVGTCRDVTEDKQAEILHACENRILEGIAARKPLTETLETIVRVIEEQAEGMLCSILLLDPDGVHIRHGAAPSLPESYSRMIDGQPIGPRAGSCGTAAFLRKPVIVTDIAADPLWADYRDLALAHGLASCWSTPIFAGDGTVLGTFAMYYRQPRCPTAVHQRLIACAVHVARIAIERQRDDDALRLHEAQLLRYQKMEAVGQLAGGMAHDFNNLLGVITGYAELLLRQFRSAQPATARLEEILKATDRGAALTRQLLTFSRGQVVEARVLDVNAVVRGMDEMLRRLINESIALETALAEDLGHVKADAGQLGQVIMNLAINARDAMPRGGRLVLRTANVVLDEADLLPNPGVRPGPHVMLEMSDTGHGMDERTLSRIFEPFFTTKERGKGTGLGLAMVYGIVRQAGGFVAVTSEVGTGTTIRVYLPRVDGPCDESAPARPARSARRSTGGTVLLVEDDPSLRQLTHELLAVHGYTVLAAGTAAEAISAAAGHAGDIPLMLTDVVLTDSSGPELAMRVRSKRPEMRVLYVSGYADQTLAAHGLATKGVDFLQKPFSERALIDRIQNLLGS